MTLTTQTIATARMTKKAATPTTSKAPTTATTIAATMYAKRLQT